MKLDFVKRTEDKLSALPGATLVVDAQDDTKVLPQSSLESYSTEAMVPNQNCDQPADGQVMPRTTCRNLPFERLVIEEGDTSVVKWTFYLNTVNMCHPMIGNEMMNEFILLLDQVTSNDYLEIWAPSYIDEFFAVGMYNIFQKKLKDVALCKRTRIHGPYILCTGGALFLTLPCEKTISDNMFCEISPPSVFAAGAHLDSVAGITQQMDLFKQIYIQFTSCGLLTKTEYDQLMEDQQCVILFGKGLADRLSSIQPQ